MLKDPRDRRKHLRRKWIRRAWRGERVAVALPARQMNVPARPLFTGSRLGEEAGAQAHRSRELLDGELQQRSVVRGAEPAPWTQVQLQQSGAGFRMHRRQLDPQPFERRHEACHEGLEATELGEAVADPTRERMALRVPQPDLVFEGRHHLVAEVFHRSEGSPQHRPRGELAGGAVGPAGRRQTDAPALPPPQVVKGLGVRMNDEVRGAGSDPEPLVVRDGAVDRVQPQEEIGHDGAVLQRGLEGRRPERLPADRAVDVRDSQENERGLGGAHRPRPAGAGPARAALTVRPTSTIVAAKRSTISASSSSVLT